MLLPEDYIMSAVGSNPDKVHGVARDFDYQEYLESSGVFNVVEGFSDSELIQIYGETIYKAKKDELPDRNTRREAFDEAHEIVESYEIGENIYNGIYNSPEDILIDAVSEGVIEDIELDVPWHPAVYFDDNMITTVPMQHSSAVFYSGRERHNFFDREYKEENVLHKIRADKVSHMFNPDSVLETGHFKAGNRLRDRGTQRSSEDGSEEWAVYGGDIDIASGYASPIIVEFEVPSEDIVITSDDQPQLRSETVEEFFQKHDSPSEAKEYSSFTVKVASNQEKQLWNPHIDLESVNGVWDPEYFPNTYHFLPLDEYVRRIQEDFDAVPEVGLEQFRTEREGYTFRRSRGQEYDYSAARKEVEIMAEIEEEAAMAIEFIEGANSNLLEEKERLDPVKDEKDLHRTFDQSIVKNLIFANESMDILEANSSNYIENNSIPTIDLLEFQQSDNNSISESLEEIKRGSAQARKQVLNAVEEENIDREDGSEVMEAVLNQNISNLRRIEVDEENVLKFARQIHGSWVEINDEQIEKTAESVIGHWLPRN